LLYYDSEAGGASKLRNATANGIRDFMLGADLQAIDALSQTAYGLGFLELADAAAARTKLALGTAATSAASAFEASLSNPAGNGYYLTSTTSGVRSWVAPLVAGTDYLAPNGNGSSLTGVALTGGSYSNPLWITALSGDKITSGTIADARLATTLAGKTLTSPVINLGSDATGDVYYRSAGGAFTRLAIGTAGQVLKVSGGLPSWGTDATGAGGVAWGGITGTLSDQTDLQTAINARQAGDATLTAFAALAIGADKLPYGTGTDTFALADFTAFARTLLDDADAGTMRATLGLAINSNVQAWDADLDTVASNGSAYYLSRANHTGTQAASTIT
jgi:hypothetical protein